VSGFPRKKSTQSKPRKAQARKPTWRPRPHQRRAVKFGLERPAAGLIMKPGLGKTSVALAIFDVLQTEDVVDQLWVITRKRVCENVWTLDDPEADLAKWANFERFSLVEAYGPKRPRPVEALPDDGDVYVFSFESFKDLVRRAVKPAKKKGGRPKTEYIVEPSVVRHLKRRRVMLLVDESTGVKHTSTDRFKRLRKLLPLFSRRYIATGTPRPNGLMDLFGQAYVLDLGAALGPYITHFRNNYFSPTGYGGYTWVPQPGAEERIYERLKELFLTLDYSDYRELPPLIEQDIKVTLPPTARKAYDKLEKEFFLEFDSGVVDAKNAGTASNKLRQIANGGVYTQRDLLSLDPSDSPKKEKRKSIVLHDEKTRAALELLDELGDEAQVMIAYEFHHDLERLRAALGEDTPYIGGGAPVKMVKRAIADWNAGRPMRLLVQPGSAAHGLNLHRGGTAIILHSLFWDYEHYEQLLFRIRRADRTEPVYLYRILARGTVDTLRVSPALRDKAAGQDAFIEAVRSYRASKSRK